MDNYPRNYIVSTLSSIAISSLLCVSALGQQIYSGICDASAAISLDSAHFLVAEDENEKIYLYRNDGFALKGRHVTALKSFDFSNELHVGKETESDIEGAARVGSRVFWITSHGRNKKGKLRKERYRLFATDIVNSSTELRLVFSGSYAGLAEDMLVSENWRLPKAQTTQQIIATLKAATRLEEKKVKRLAPKREGLNIEALAVLPDGSGLLIGLRNPVLGGKALVVPLLNASELLGGGSATARFGQPIMLDTGDLGLRSMEYVPAINAFLLVAGPIDGGESFVLFKWSGTPEAKMTKLGELHHSQGINPEALIVYDDSARIQVLHDEGSRKTEGANCKDLPASELKHFSDQWYVVQ